MGERLTDEERFAIQEKYIAGLESTNARLVEENRRIREAAGLVLAAWTNRGLNMALDKLNTALQPHTGE